MPHYLVVFDVGARLLGDEISIGSVTIGTTPPIPVERHPGVDVEVSGAHWVNPKVSFEFATDTYYWTTVEAADAEMALAQVETDYDPYLSAALSYQAGFHVVTRPAFIHSYDGPRPWMYSHFRIITDQRFDADALNRLTNALKGDDTLRTASKALTAGRNLAIINDAFTRNRLTDASLLQYARCIEVLANSNRIEQEPESDDKLDRKRDKAILKLQRKLESENTRAARLEAIRVARQTLHQLDGYTMARNFQRLGEVLGLGTNWGKLASALASARNESLGHPGPALSPEQLDELAGHSGGETLSAERAAELALVAFAEKFLH